MSIYIKGMATPKCCNECWALDDDGDYPRCRITEEQRGYTFKIREQKMSKCPLTEVPEPHGRLIDADRLKEVFYRNVISAEAFDCIFDNAPTVIERSET